MAKQKRPKLCACGCGLPLRMLFTDGRFKGYSGKYAPSCPNRDRLIRRTVPSRAHHGMEHPKALPIGSRRKHRSTNRLIYWTIKVDESGKWLYEHRVIAERLIGRKLRPSEHVHHISGDTLDNRPENLRVLTHPEHVREHLAIASWSKNYAACIDCGETTRRHSSHGRCTRCHQKHIYVPRTK